MGFDKVSKLFEKQNIEIAPLAYMRGRTLNHAFIILDEAQNTTPEQMKMFLTRIGIRRQGGGHRRRHARSTCRAARSRGLVEARRSPERRARPGLHRFRRLGRGAPSAGAAHRRRLREARQRRDARRLPELHLSVQYPGGRRLRRRRPQVRRWVRATLHACRPKSTVRFVGAAEGRQLNRDYRGKDYATNVLSFPYEAGSCTGGDLVLCRAGRRTRSARSRARRLKPTTPTWWCMVCCICRATTTKHRADDAEAHGGPEAQDSVRPSAIADPYS
jgi:hypothetical protein